MAEGHIKPSTSAWNSLVFVMLKKKKKKEKKEKSKKWRLLTNLKTINVYIQPRGSLQPDLPNPALIPQS